MKWPWQPRQVETKQMALGLTDSLGKFLMFGQNTATTPGSALSLYEQSTCVSIPVNTVADAFSVLEPVLVVGNEMVVDHPVLKLLKRPSPFYSGELFLEVMAKNYLITGEAAVIGLGNVNRPPLQLQPMSPHVATPVREEASDVATSWSISGSTLLGVYRATPNINALIVRYLNGNLRELFVMRNFSTRNNSLLRGQSLLVSAAREARQHILGTQHNVSLLEKGGRVSLVFHYEEDMNEDDFEEVKNRIREQWGGATKAGEIAVTSGSKLDIKEAGTNNRDMDFAALQMMAFKAVALQYHVPIPLISDQRQTLNNYGIAKMALYDDAVIPLAGRVFGGLSDFLLPRYGMDPTEARITFNPETVSALVTRRNDELKKRSSLGVETDNEIRALLGREPYDGGNIHYKNAALVPVGTDLFTDDEKPGILEDAPGQRGASPGKEGRE